MVLIAIDKHSRRILGYLCKNDQTITYCCSECDVEFLEAFALEAHMITHEQKSNEAETQPIPHVEEIQEIPLVDDDKADETQCEKPEPEPEPEPQAEPEPVEASSEAKVEVQAEIQDQVEAEVEAPSKPLSSVERENLLKIKYQVMPCSVLLDRDDSNRYLSGGASTTTDQDSISSEGISNPSETDEPIEALTETTDTPPNKSIESPEPMSSRTSSKASLRSDDVPLKQLKRKRLPPKKAVDLLPTDDIMTKRRKMPTQKTPLPANKKPLPKPKPSPQKSVCFLCGEQFASGIQLTQHQKTHFASTISQAPVFPCNVCGKKVKNLKVHLRLHEKEQQQQSQESSTNGKVVKRRGKQSKPNESQVSDNSNKADYVTEETVPMVETTTVAELTYTTVASSDTFVKRAEASSSTDAVFSRIPCESNEEAELISSNEMFATSNDSNVSSYNFIGDCMTDTDALLIFSDQFMLPPPPSSSTSCVAIIDPSFVPSAMDPLNLMDEDPLEIPSLMDLDAICVNEPSQSTSAVVANDGVRLPQPQQSNDENTFQPNGMNVDKRRKKKNEKSNDEQSGEQPQQAVANQPPFKCSKCSRHFDTLDRVTKHCKKHDKKTNCKFCGKLLAQSYVYFHISKYHKAERAAANVPVPVNTADDEDEDGEEDEEVEDAEPMAIETETVPPTTEKAAEVAEAENAVEGQEAAV